MFPRLVHVLFTKRHPDRVLRQERRCVQLRVVRSPGNLFSSVRDLPHQVSGRRCVQVNGDRCIRLGKDLQALVQWALAQDSRRRVRLVPAAVRVDRRADRDSVTFRAESRKAR